MKTELFMEIMQERKRQDDKWGEQNHDVLFWNIILVEEVGEVSRAIFEKNPEDVRKELVQVAAVAVAWLESIERRKCGETKTPTK